MALIIKKFGGTSVSTPQRRRQVLEKIIREKEKGNDVAVVVSAMGRRGDPYATDTFLDILREAAPEAAPRTRDLLAACGEVIAACIVAEELAARGYPALPFTGSQAGIQTDSNFTNGAVKAVAPERLRAALAAGSIAVVTGFQGCDAAGDLVTLGRGGSDTTAIALGGALAADVVEIFTDVPGIAYTDPRLVPSAPFLASIAFEPMYILAKTGAKVIHHRAVETAIQFERPFWVRSTFSEEPGTLVGRPGEAPGGLYGIALLNGMALASRTADPEGELAALACNEWFYITKPGRVAAVLAPERLRELPAGCQVREAGAITLQWAPETGVTAAAVAAALAPYGAGPEDYFPVPGGGAWIVPPAQAPAAVMALYRAPLGGG
ncbi:MAG: hypothetical protein LBK98_03080 [Peptococcaceae bacterium]|jgi:aspartate kinase|nr:hypothetical protein [Peptococcaceae bacterium]